MKKLIVLILALTMVTMYACDSAKEPAQEETTETTAATTTVAQLTDEEIYDALLAKLTKRLNKIISDDTHLDGFSSEKGMIGAAEIASEGGVGMISKFGYAIDDINEDGVKDLIICQVDENCTGTRILCAYTAHENEAVLLVETSSEVSNYYIDDLTLNVDKEALRSTLETLASQVATIELISLTTVNS